MLIPVVFAFVCVHTYLNFINYLYCLQKDDEEAVTPDIDESWYTQVSYIFKY